MSPVRVLVIYGANGSGPDALASELAEALTREGIFSEACAAEDVEDLDGYDAVAVGDARRAGHWHPFACRFARRHANELRNLPAWFLSSIPAASEGREQEQVRRWARSVAALLIEPSPNQPLRARRVACTFLGSSAHRCPRGVQSRWNGRTIRPRRRK